MSERKAPNKSFPPDFGPSTAAGGGAAEGALSPAVRGVRRGRPQRREVQRSEGVGPERSLPGARPLPLLRPVPPLPCGDHLRDGPREQGLRSGARGLPAEKPLQKEGGEEELSSPMKGLEDRSEASEREMELLGNLQELKDLNRRQAHVDFESMLQRYRGFEVEQKRLAVEEKEEDQREMRAMLDQAQARRRLEDSNSDRDPARAPAKAFPKAEATDIWQEESDPQAKKLKGECWERSIGQLSSKAGLSGLVVAKRKVDYSPPNGAVAQNRPGGSGAGSQSTEASHAAQSSGSRTSGSSSLSLLGAYSDSEDSQSD